MNLLGFYQEGRENATTEVVFVPVSNIPVISQGEILETQRLLQTEMKSADEAKDNTLPFVIQHLNHSPA
ncbi:unnamed protein product [Peronospora destructor]|uniref:Uncharacterized protein n=1 Tax=Peronospora destructor TaxID=86335 RepID=A0AAV0U1Y0_9STRA|nr:unnamed protein product [Peronospora destructor]